MKKIFSFQSSKEHYVAAACVVWCFDDRFSGLLDAFFGAKDFDLIKVAGGAKVLAEGLSPERDFVLSQIKTSVHLHGAKRIALMLHRDCGAYGGSKNFADADSEKGDLADKLVVAKQVAARMIPGVPISVYFVDFDGVYEVE